MVTGDQVMLVLSSCIALEILQIAFRKKELRINPSKYVTYFFINFENNNYN